WHRGPQCARVRVDARRSQRGTAAPLRRTRQARRRRAEAEGWLLAQAQGSPRRVSAEWWQLRITCRAEETDQVAVALVEARGRGVEEIELGLLASVVSSEAEATRLISDLAVPFPGLTGTVARVDSVDWSIRWRDGIVTRTFGRLILTPSWLP